MLLRVHFSDGSHQELLCRLLSFILDPLVVTFTQFCQSFQCLNIALMLISVLIKFQAISPALLVQIAKHFLFSLILAVIDGDWVVVFIETSQLGNHTWWSHKANIRSCLTWFHSRHHNLARNTTEGVDDHLTLNRLDGINNDSHRSWIQVFLLLLRLNIGARKPRTETWMWVIPTDYILLSTHLLHLIHEFLLKYRIDRLDWHSCSHLRHWKDIYDCNGVIIDDLSDHEAHDFEGDTGSAMLHHFKQR